MIIIRIYLACFAPSRLVEMDFGELMAGLWEEREDGVRESD